MRINTNNSSYLFMFCTCTTNAEQNNLEIYHIVKGSLLQSVSKIGSSHWDKSVYHSTNFQSLSVQKVCGICGIDYSKRPFSKSGIILTSVN